MKTLKFKHDFVKEIIEKRKTTTWRLFDDKNLQVNDEIGLIDALTRKVFGNAIIIDIQEKVINNLTEEELRNHQYNSKEDMIENHNKYYGNKVTLDTIVKIIEFKIK